MPVDETLRGLIHEGASETELATKAFAKRNNLIADGAAAVVSGVTSADEVLRVCHRDEG